MNGYLRQSTASQVRTIGPFVDDTDFKTLENALSIANTDVKIKKNGAASANKNSGGATADGSAGLYAVTWDATDTATVGELSFSVKVAGALVVFGTYTVLEEAAYDATFAAASPGYVTDQPVNVTKWAGLTVTTGDIAIKTSLAKTTHITGFNDLSTTQIQSELTTYGALKPTVAGRTFAVNAAGQGGIDWANIGAPTTAQGLSGTTISTSQVVASVTGAVGSVTGSVGSVTGGATAANQTTILSRLGTPSDLGTGASLSANLVDVENQTDNLPGMEAILAKLDTTWVLDGAVYQFTANALELGPSGGGGLTVTDIADAILKRDMSAVTGESSRSLLNAIRLLRNKWNTTETPNTLTVKKEDDSTTAWTAPLTTDPAAEPITGMDPA